MKKNICILCVCFAMMTAIADTNSFRQLFKETFKEYGVKMYYNTFSKLFPYDYYTASGWFAYFALNGYVWYEGCGGDYIFCTGTCAMPDHRTFEKEYVYPYYMDLVTVLNNSKNIFDRDTQCDIVDLIIFETLFRKADVVYVVPKGTQKRLILKTPPNHEETCPY